MYCEEHRKPGNRLRDKETAADHGLEGGFEPPKPIDSEVSRQRRMAIGLSMTSRPEAAAGAVGLDLTPTEAKSLARKARKAHDSLISGGKAGIAKMGHATLALLYDHLLNSVHIMGPGQTSNAIKAVVQSIDAYQGGTHMAHTEIVMNVSAPTPEQLKEWGIDGTGG